MTASPGSEGLTGRVIMVTRALDQAAGFARLIEERGAIPFLFPTIRTQAVAPDERAAEALRGLAAFDAVVFTSVNGVRYFFDALASLGVDANGLERLEVAAVGTATAAALTARGVTVTILPDEFIAESLVDAVAAQLPPGARVLVPRPVKTREKLGPGLAERGFEAVEAVLYETVADDSRVGEAARALEGRRVDAVTFTSGSTARNFVRLLEGRIDLASALDGVAVAVIGPATAKTAAEVGLRVDVMPLEHTTAAMLDELEKHFRATGRARR